MIQNLPNRCRDIRTFLPQPPQNFQNSSVKMHMNRDRGQLLEIIISLKFHSSIMYKPIRYKICSILNFFIFFFCNYRWIHLASLFDFSTLFKCSAKLSSSMWIQTIKRGTFYSAKISYLNTLYFKCFDKLSTWKLISLWL